MAAQYPYDVDLLKNGDGAGDNGAQAAQASPEDAHAAPSALYSSGPAFPPSSSAQTSTLLDQDGQPRDGARVDAAAAPVPGEEYAAEVKEDGLGAIPPKSRRWSRRKLLIGLCALLVVLGATLGGALGATLGKHSSSDAATKTSSSMPPSSTTSGVSSGSTSSTSLSIGGAMDSTSSTTTTATAGAESTTGATMTSTAMPSSAPVTGGLTSTTTTTSTSSPPVFTPGVAYLISNHWDGGTVVMTVDDLSGTDGKIFGRSMNDDTQNQTWLVEASEGGGFWYIRSTRNIDAWITYNVPVHEYDSVITNPNAAQWFIESIPDGEEAVRIRAYSYDNSTDLGNLVLALTSDDHNSTIALAETDDSFPQHWQFIPA